MSRGAAWEQRRNQAAAYKLNRIYQAVKSVARDCEIQGGSCRANLLGWKGDASREGYIVGIKHRGDRTWLLTVSEKGAELLAKGVPDGVV